MSFSFFRKNRTSNNIDTGTRIAGNIHSENSWKISGMLVGDLIAMGDVSIEDTAEIVGNVTGVNISVAGKVRGNVHAQRNLHLFPTSSIDGDIRYQTIAIEVGAQMSGLLQVNIPLIESSRQAAAKADPPLSLQVEKKKRTSPQQSKEQYTTPVPEDGPKHKRIMIQ